MDAQTKIQMLQMTYIGQTVDAIRQMDIQGVLEKATEIKRKEQLKTGGKKAKRYGLTAPEQIFLFFGESLGNINS
ncbi:MAG: hypothetical protein ACE5WD_08565 [Candidatus Aminicenantia bacterium]